MWRLGWSRIKMKGSRRQQSHPSRDRMERFCDALLKFRAVFELLKARVDLGARQAAEAIDSELLATKTAQNRSVDHRAAQIGVRDLAGAWINSLSGQISDKSSGKTIS